MNEIATVKFPLKGTPSSPNAVLDARPTIIAAIIDSPKQIKTCTVPCTLQGVCAWFFDKKGTFGRVHHGEIAIHMVVTNAAACKVAMVSRHSLDVIVQRGFPLYSVGFIPHLVVITGTNRPKRLTQYGLESFLHESSFLLLFCYCSARP
jgi:hypothetical protein